MKSSTIINTPVLKNTLGLSQALTTEADSMAFHDLLKKSTQLATQITSLKNKILRFNDLLEQAFK